MGLGLNLVAAQSVSMKTMRVSLRSILKTLLKSAPFVTYVLLFVFAFLNLSVPSYIMDVANVAGGANSFLSMFMIGLLIRLDLPKEKLKAIYKTVWARTLLNTALIVLILFFMPIPATARIVTALCIASPVGSISPIYALQCGYKGDLVGMASSLSIFVSIVQILAILIIFA